MLEQSLSGARMVGEDRNHGYMMAWFGGHGIHAYSLDGEEVAFWNVGDFERMEAEAEDVEKNMKAQIVSGQYMDYIER